MTPVLILPGIGGSGPEHWQSRWEASEPSYHRVQMPDWDRPELGQWVQTLERAVQDASAPPVIVAHSLGCLALVHWAALGKSRIRGALLVAVPDPTGLQFPEAAVSFGPVPLKHLPFHSLVVASVTDPYGSFEFAALCAKAWGSTLHDAGDRGHLNAQSALGDWSEGRALLARLLV